MGSIISKLLVITGECFFWYRLTRVVPDKFHRAVKRLCVCVCTGNLQKKFKLFHFVLYCTLANPNHAMSDCYIQACRTLASGCSGIRIVSRVRVGVKVKVMD